MEGDLQIPTAVQLALLGATLSAIGWLLSHFVSMYSEARRSKLVWKLEYTRQQLEELYGPLVFLVEEGRQTFADFCSMLGRTSVFGSAPLLEHELAAWLFWAENDFLPRNRAIRDLISTNTHLIEGTRMPVSFRRFIEHQASWAVLHERWQVQQVEYSWHSSVNLPDEFAEEVIEAFDQLKSRHQELIGLVGGRE